MKKLFLALGLLALIAFSASAQTPIYAPQSITLATNYVAASTASNTTVVISCQKQASVAVQITQQCDAAGTANVSYFFLKSVDGITYETTPGQLVSVAANGTTAVTTTTNLNTQGVGYLKLGYITNAAASANLTNVTLKYAVKISAP